MKDQLLIVGLVVALASGFVIGYLARGEQPVQSLFPANYDPARPIVTDALKASQEATERCYQQMVAFLASRAGQAPPETPKTDP